MAPAVFRCVLGDALGGILSSQIYVQAAGQVLQAVLQNVIGRVTQNMEPRTSTGEVCHFEKDFRQQVANEQERYQQLVRECFGNAIGGILPSQIYVQAAGQVQQDSVAPDVSQPRIPGCLSRQRLLL